MHSVLTGVDYSEWTGFIQLQSLGGFFFAHPVLTPSDPWATVFGLDVSLTVRVSPSNQPGGNFLISGSPAKHIGLFPLEVLRL